MITKIDSSQIKLWEPHTEVQIENFLTDSLDRCIPQENTQEGNFLTKKFEELQLRFDEKKANEYLNYLLDLLLLNFSKERFEKFKAYAKRLEENSNSSKRKK